MRWPSRSPRRWPRAGHYDIDSTTVRAHVSAAGGKGGFIEFLAARGAGSPVKFILSESAGFQHSSKQRSYDPVRLPPEPPPPLQRRRGRDPRPRRVSPDCPHRPFRRAVPITPADQTGAHVDFLPRSRGFPVIQAGRRPHLHFRGLLELHSRYGPSDCSTAQGGLCHEASIRPVAQPNRSPATRSIDNSLGGILLHS